MSQHPIDRSGWPAGPWDDEPDRDEWRHAGLPCLALRNGLGAWCGYVAVPPGHPAYGKDCGDVDASVHGGLTYSHRCAGDICHVPREGETDDVWWLGFDCCHLGDEAPGLIRFTTSQIPGWGKYLRDSYKPLAYVRMVTEELADQLAAMRDV
jgi:hypothetical protein